MEEREQRQPRQSLPKRQQSERLPAWEQLLIRIKNALPEEERHLLYDLIRTIRLETLSTLINGIDHVYTLQILRSRTLRRIRDLVGDGQPVKCLEPREKNGRTYYYEVWSENGRKGYGGRKQPPEMIGLDIPDVTKPKRDKKPAGTPTPTPVSSRKITSQETSTGDRPMLTKEVLLASIDKLSEAEQKELFSALSEEDPETPDTMKILLKFIQCLPEESVHAIALASTKLLQDPMLIREIKLLIRSQLIQIYRGSPRHITIKTVKGKRYVYEQWSNNGKTESRYIGPERLVDLSKVGRPRKRRTAISSAEEAEQKQEIRAAWRSLRSRLIRTLS